ncbi:hypothetical protein [Caldicellulosiruptor morganii]|uniref:Uncharacterized protein n=1 Tax=Caldicellulosiruptor morganii TaxID=1387555 RepID=A0ABY7BQN2_9FIRM|nr:hypothetical protein [Caldicellulosiruptor morganii]WAM33346.1 hypothetical protein OTK00_001841 [Caldicellulosiruptor morganii]
MEELQKLFQLVSPEQFADKAGKFFYTFFVYFDNWLKPLSAIFLIIAAICILIGIPTHSDALIKTAKRIFTGIFVAWLIRVFGPSFISLFYSFKK